MVILVQFAIIILFLYRFYTVGSELLKLRKDKHDCLNIINKLENVTIGYKIRQAISNSDIVTIKQLINNHKCRHKHECVYHDAIRYLHKKREFEYKLFKFTI